MKTRRHNSWDISPTPTPRSRRKPGQISRSALVTKTPSCARKDAGPAAVSQGWETPGEIRLSDFYSEPHAPDASEKREGH